MIRKFTDNFFKGEKVSESIMQSAVLIAGMGLTSRLLGLVRDRMLASKFGAGDILDAYYTAFKIPDLVYSLLILGALSAAFIPTFSSLIVKKERRLDAWQLVNVVLSIGVVFVGLISVILFIFSDRIVGLLVFGYSEEKKELIIQMTKIMLFGPILLGISGIFGGILNSFKKFFFYSLSPIFYNLGIIIGIVFFVDFFGPIGLSLGVVLGALLHLLIQLPEVFRCGFRFSWQFDWQNKYFKKVIKLMIPRALGIASSQINLIVVIVLASTLQSGSLAVFNFANNLQSVPLGIFGISFAVASFPVLSRLWAKKKVDDFVSQLTSTLRNIIFFVIPLSALMYVLRAQIIRVILGTGKFNWEDTVLTFSALGIFLFSLWAQSLIPLLSRSFYAMHNTKAPFFIALLSEILNILLALSLIQQFGILGLVWSFTISANFNAVTLFFWLRFKVGKIRDRGVIRTFLKVFLATIIMLMAIQFFKKIISAEPFGKNYIFWGVFVQLSISILVGLIVFVVVGKILKIKELNNFIFFLQNKFRITKSVKRVRDEIN